MAKINWKNSAGGDFGTGLNWSTGTVPGPSDIANINASGTYTVTSSTSPTVLAITTIPTAKLDVTGSSSFTALAGTGVGANAGTIAVETNSSFDVGGTVKNSGFINLNNTAVLLIARDTILQGGGQLTLSHTLSGFPTIEGNTLTNVDNVISGVGAIDITALVNQNKGVIDANGSSQLQLNAISLTNAGLLEATSTGGLSLVNSPINNSASGVIGAFGAGSTVTLDGNGTKVSGGTLETANGGEILVYAATLDGSNGHTVTNTGSVGVAAAYTLFLLGTISNTGTIALNSGSHIIVDTGGATLAGSGNVTLSDNTATSILGNGANTTLTNQNTISGAGEIGGQGLLLTNQA